jgi:hypothetical protein
VTFTGEVAPTKEPSLTNRHVRIELRSTTAREGGKPVTLVGRLRKDVAQAGGAVDAQGRPVKASYPGARWWIEGGTK